MKKLFTIAMLISLTGFAETAAHKTAAPETQTPAQISTTQELYEAPVGQVFIGPGMVILGPITGFGVNANLGFKVNETSYSASYLGFDFGYYNIAGRFSVVPILFSSSYRFNIGKSIVHPKVGVGVGIGLLNVASAYAQEEYGNGASTNQTTLLLVFKPGVDFDVAKNVTISAEPKFGLLQSLFFFAPSVNVGFSF